MFPREPEETGMGVHELGTVRAALSVSGTLQLTVKGARKWAGQNRRTLELAFGF